MLPLIITPTDLDRIVVKAYRATKLGKMPDEYPTVDDIDALLDSPEFMNDMALRKNVIQAFIIMIMYGFDKDKLWHEKNPGKEEATPENLKAYLFNPIRTTECHAGVWLPETSWREKDSRQASFDYIQSILTDPSIMQIATRQVKSRYRSNKRAKQA